MKSFYLQYHPNNRGIWEHADALRLSDITGTARQNLLLIGGGKSSASALGCMTRANIYNVDFEVYADSTEKIRQIQADYTELNACPNKFDMALSLFCLPMYAVSERAVNLFFLKTALNLKPDGQLRFSPVLAGNLEDREKHIGKNLEFLASIGFTVILAYKPYKKLEYDFQEATDKNDCWTEYFNNLKGVHYFHSNFEIHHECAVIQAPSRYNKEVSDKLLCKEIESVNKNFPVETFEVYAENGSRIPLNQLLQNKNALFK
ncbi:MAG: hypothetical protein LBJ73_02095 [Rickettsiales bacterium]|jgi:hypothetical protein|nr:hypothetical protein [Rickettsiales bacterium]